MRKHDDICNSSAPIRTSDKDGNIEIVVKTVVNSLVNTVVGILDGDGEILDDDDDDEEERGSKRVNSGIMSIDEREELEKELIRDKTFFFNLAEGEVVSDTIASVRASEESLSRKQIWSRPLSKAF